MSDIGRCKALRLQTPLHYSVLQVRHGFIVNAGLSTWQAHQRRDGDEVVASVSGSNAVR